MTEKEMITLEIGKVKYEIVDAEARKDVSVLKEKAKDIDVLNSAMDEAQKNIEDLTGAILKPDKNLEKDGYAADAKVVGDRIRNIEDSMITQINEVLPDEDGKAILTPKDIGALPEDYIAPVTSVNYYTGDVKLNAQDVGAISIEGGYSSGTIGAAKLVENGQPLVNKYAQAKSYEVCIDWSKWKSETGKPPYQQAIPVQGLTIYDTPICDINLKYCEVTEIPEAVQQWNLITRMYTEKNTLVAIATEGIPSATIWATLLVVGTGTERDVVEGGENDLSMNTPDTDTDTDETPDVTDGENTEENVDEGDAT